MSVSLRGQKQELAILSDARVLRHCVARTLDIVGRDTHHSWILTLTHSHPHSCRSHQRLSQHHYWDYSDRFAASPQRWLKHHRRSAVPVDAYPRAGRSSSVCPSLRLSTAHHYPPVLGSVSAAWRCNYLKSACANSRRLIAAAIFTIRSHCQWWCRLHC